MKKNNSIHSLLSLSAVSTAHPRIHFRIYVEHYVGRGGRSKTQVTFHRSLVAGNYFTFFKVTQNPQLANPRPKKQPNRPRVSQIEGFGYNSKGKTMTCYE